MTSTVVLTIGELARRSGLTAHTIRYYVSEGVLRAAGRAPNGHRRYRPIDVLWLEFVLRLKKAGMPLAEIRQYAELREQGDATVQQRLAMLQLHRGRLAAQMAELADSASALDDKIRTYRKLVSGSSEPSGDPTHGADPPHDNRDGRAAVLRQQPLRARRRQAARD